MKTFVFDYDIKTIWQNPTPTYKARIFANDKIHAKEILKRNFGYGSDFVIHYDTLKETNYCLVSKLHKLDVKYY